MSQGTSPSGQRQLHGILLMLAASLMFSLLDLQAKYLAQSQPVMQIAWARYFGHFVLMMVFLWPRHGRTLLRTGRPVLQIVRSLLLLLCTVLFFLALKFLPLADAVAVSFVSPVIATALSVPFLRENVGMHRWTAVAVGLIGALIIVRPGLGVMHWAVFLALGTAFFFAVFQLTTRMLSTTDDALVTLYYSALIGAVILSVIVPFYWAPTPGLRETVMLAGLGLFAGFGHYLLIKSFEYAPLSVLAPLNYSSLLWGALLGYLVFRDFPDAFTLLGAGVLIATGIYIVYREGLKENQT